MNFKKFIIRERSLWHAHFWPSLIAAIIVGVVSYFYEATVSGIILFASVGASAIILTNTKSHHLTKLRTTIDAYLIATILAVMIYGLNLAFTIHFSINIFLIVFLVGFSQYLLNSLHPPAIAASVAFILEGVSPLYLAYLLITLLVVLLIVRFFAYVFSQHLDVKEFFREFKRSF